MEEIWNIVSDENLTLEERLKKAQERLLQKNIGYGDNLQKILDSVKDYGKPIPTGFPDIDTLMNGGFRQGLTILGAPPGMGKSTFAGLLAEQFSAAGVQTVYLCNDMAVEEMIAKALSRHTYEIAGEQGFTAAQILGNEAIYLHPTFQQALERFRQKSRMLRFEGHDLASDFENIKLLMEIYGAYRTSEYAVVIIDFLQNVSVKQYNMGAKEKVDFLVGELGSLAKNLGIVVIAISSVSRGAYHMQMRMESMKESGAIEFKADLMLGLHYKGIEQSDFDEYDAASKPIRELELIVLKSRLGGIGKSIPIRFYAKFNVIPWYNDPIPKLPRTPIEVLLKRK